MTSPQPGQNTSQFQFVCAFVAVSPLIYMGIATAMKLSGALPEDGLAAFPPDLATTISLVLLAAGMLSSASSILLRTLLMNSRPTELPAERFRVALVSMAMAESGAVMGLVLMLLSGNLMYGGLLCGLSLAITWFHFPSRHWLEHGDSAL